MVYTVPTEKRKFKQHTFKCTDSESHKLDWLGQQLGHRTKSETVRWLINYGYIEVLGDAQFEVGS